MILEENLSCFVCIIHRSQAADYIAIQKKIIRSHIWRNNNPSISFAIFRNLLIIRETYYHIIICFKHFDLPRKFARQPHIITVKESYKPTFGIFHSNVTRLHRTARWTRSFKRLNTLITLHKLLNDHWRIVRGTIINNQQFPILVCL